MNTNTNSPDFLEKILQDTAVGDFWHNSPVYVHAALIVLLASLVSIRRVLRLEPAVVFQG